MNKLHFYFFSKTLLLAGLLLFSCSKKDNGQEEPKTPTETKAVPPKPYPAPAPIINSFGTYYGQRQSLFELLPISSDDIVFLGNSITDGAEWGELFADIHVKNRGISGDITDGVLARLGNILRGKPKKIYRKLFPAYVMLEMEATREENEHGISYKVDPRVWYEVRNTNGVTGFVGVGSDPIPMEEEEVKNIFNIIGVKTPKETIKIDFAEGDYVKILKGSFKDQEGQVAEIDNEHGRVKVMVDIFGRMTPVEIEVDGVLKV